MLVKKKRKYKRHKDYYDIDLHGCDCDEAIQKLENYIENNAFFENKNKVYINHGKGTGKLAKAVANFLKNCKFVSKFEYAPFYQGGSGIIIAYLNYD
ncbi:MAG TPA: Smr/MutS family protein [bacterium]|nr:Smr/MutS family protein [bacterium]HOL46928.1 Smr/MutS family protein [bacterium]HPQ18310.1 Smr/MutS family protein [bacterium]